MPIEIRIGTPPGPGKDPWLVREDWAARRVRDEGGPLLIVVLWAFALFWYGMLSLAGWAIGTSPPRPGSGGAGAVLILFAVAGLLPLTGAVYVTWHALRFRRSTFVMDALPFAVGGWVSGVVEAPPVVAGAETFEVTLDCVDVSASSRRTFRTTRWREEVTVCWDRRIPRREVAW